MNAVIAGNSVKCWVNTGAKTERDTFIRHSNIPVVHNETLIHNTFYFTAEYSIEHLNDFLFLFK